MSGRLRTRGAGAWGAASLQAVEALRPAQQALLRDWLRGDASQRRWQTLLDAAGPDRLELADALREQLLACGALQARERLARGQWQVEHIVWADLAALQQALGLRDAATRAADQLALARDADALALHAPWLQGAVQDLASGRYAEATRRARLQLLQALADWQAEQRFGLQRDFAQFARGQTKAISAGEWDWLARHIDLAARGIARFAPLLWLGGTLSLHAPQGRVDVAAARLCGLPVELFAAPTEALAPERYWLIENRASFERQALGAAPGTCVVWLPGQPPTSWQQAMAWLITAAPAPAQISCDPDPAGVAIALTAGALWSAAGLPWQPYRMDRSDWENAPAIALTAEDGQWLARLQARADLPEPLARLCADLRATGRKAEQEAWL